MADWWRQLSDGITGFADQLVQQASNAQKEIEREHEQFAQQSNRQNAVLKGWFGTHSIVIYIRFKFIFWSFICISQRKM